MKRSIVCVVALFVLAVCQPSKAEWTFQGLGTLPGMDFSRAYGISADGRTVVGVSGTNVTWTWEAFLWTAEGGMLGLGFPPNPSPYQQHSVAQAVSADGTVIVGECMTDRGQEAFRWTAGGGMVPLGDLGLPTGEFRSEAYDVSADGSVVVGFAETDPDLDQAFLWTPTEGMVALGHLPGGTVAGAYGVSADGSVIVGFSDSSSGGQAFRWTETDGMVGLGRLPEGGGSGAKAASPDGRVIVGDARNADGRQEPFRWTEEDGMVGLGFLPGDSSSFVTAVSADGSTIVGGGSEGSNSRVFIWDQAYGMRNLRDVLVTDGGLDLEDWGLGTVWGISADGRTIVGTGRHSGTEAWIATIPEPPTSTFVIAALVFLLLFARRRRNGIAGTFGSIDSSY